MTGTQPHTGSRRNTRTLLVCLAVVAGMVGLSFAAVPLYRIFCQVTGFAGTTQIAEARSDRIVDREFRIQFDSTVGRGLPWSFHPVQREISLRAGENAVAFYRASNLASAAVTGTATFNVTPLKVGQYFNKVECFCFTEQRLEGASSVEMPVAFFVDPAIVDDPNLDDVTTITLSYTFYPARDADGGGDSRSGALAGQAPSGTSGIGG